MLRCNEQSNHIFAKSTYMKHIIIFELIRISLFILSSHYFNKLNDQNSQIKKKRKKKKDTRALN